MACRVAVLDAGEPLYVCSRLAGSSYPCGHCLSTTPAELGAWTFSPTKQLSVPRGKGDPGGVPFSSTTELLTGVAQTNFLRW
jgi:hypothetical protein